MKGGLINYLWELGQRATRPSVRDRGARKQFKRVHWGVLNVSLRASGAQLRLDICSQGAPTDPLEEVMIFCVSRGAPTDPLEEVGAIRKSAHFS